MNKLKKIFMKKILEKYNVYCKKNLTSFFLCTHINKMDHTLNTMSSNQSNSAIYFELLAVHPYHGEFYKGVLGDFVLTIHECTGFANVSKLCAFGNKRYGDWIKNKNNLDYVEALQRDAMSEGKEAIYHIKGGHEYNEINGAYVCENILYQIAQWVSIDFRIKASNIISNFYRERFNERGSSYKYFEEQLRLKDQEIVAKNEEILERNNEIIDKNNEIIGKNNEMANVYKEMANVYKELISSNEEIISKNNEIIDKNCEIMDKTIEIHNMEKKNARLKDIAVEMSSDCVPKLNDDSKRNVFALVDKGAAGSYSLTTIRTQKRRYETAFRQKKKKFPDAVNVYHLKYHPNAITFFNQIKQDVPGIKTRYNDIDLPEGYTVEKFIEEVDKIYKKLLKDVEEKVQSN